MKQFPSLGIFILCFFLTGCGNKVLSTFAIDISGSSINRASSKLTVLDICTRLIQGMESHDSLIMKQFDSKPSPGLLEKVVVGATSKKERKRLSKLNCNNLIPSAPRLGVPKGTDFHDVWLRYYQEYKDRKEKRIKEVKNKEVVVEIFIVYIDSLEEVIDDKDQEKLDLRTDFLKSFQEFIDSHNYVLFIVANPKYVNQLAIDLDSIKNEDHRLSIVNSHDDVNSMISDFYKRARARVTS